MIGNRSVIAVIPARAGSVRVPGKNTRNLCGKPMVMWTVHAAKNSMYLDKVVVTTDDPAVVSSVSGNGVQIIDRPKHLAERDSSIYDTIFHALDFFEPHDYTVLLHPTSPLRTAADIDGCIKKCEEDGAPSCISVDSSRPVANGAVYVAWTSWLREMKQFDSGRVTTYWMPPVRSIDVDYESDFRKAEKLLSTLRGAND